MLKSGFENVKQLEGGILNYLDTDASHWEVIALYLMTE